jgi:hypothetical protein
MSIAMPKFITSEYFVPEPDNWHLKEGAPEDVRKEFDEFMAEYLENEEEGIFQ